MFTGVELRISVFHCVYDTNILKISVGGNSVLGRTLIDDFGIVT